MTSALATVTRQMSQVSGATGFSALATAASFVACFLPKTLNTANFFAWQKAEMNPNCE
jgi:hypothetical protein